MGLAFGPRRGAYVEIPEAPESGPLPPADAEHFARFDLVYRSLCALLFNYVPTSGHPGGSVSSGRFVLSLLFDTMDYDVSDPDREDSDVISYAAGHKALGLYAMWALRDELLRIGAPHRLPADPRRRLRLEDLLGFRRNPVTRTPLFVKLGAKALDGHPTPATPFVRLATGASGVGLASSLGLALGAVDRYGAAASGAAPHVHIVEGEGGLTPGRAAEALAAGGTMSVGNVILHVDWNQASIDSNRVCRDGDTPGDYVQWTPAELAYLHDWNVVVVNDGFDFQRIAAAQRAALAFDNGQPTAIVYRTTKGWRYGVEGRASHGAGHALCSDGFHAAVAPLLEGAGAGAGATLPRCAANAQRCRGGEKEAVIEDCFWEALGVVRSALVSSPATVAALVERLDAARMRLDGRARAPREGAPRVEAVYEVARTATATAGPAPREVALEPGATTTLRGELGRVLNYYNVASGGALLVAAADLLGSTSVGAAAKGFPQGYFNARGNPASRTLSTGGICEDAMAGIASGISSFGHHIGVASSYGAFLAPLGHIAARLHAIGMQARRAVADAPGRPFILTCAHAGLKTGEDGPTHADPQALQLLQENFPAGTMITLTPWEPQEIWTLVASALARRPAVVAPFVTRPSERVLDREQRGLAPASASATGVYCLRRAEGRADGTVVLQESGVTYAFVETALPLLLEEGLDLNVYYVASAELFDLLPAQERERIYPERVALEAIGITGFTLPTMYRWIRSERGRAATLHPFGKGHFLGSGPAEKVLAEAGLDGESQFEAIARFVRGAKAGGRATRKGSSRFSVLGSQSSED
jgi:transketolase